MIYDGKSTEGRAELAVWLCRQLENARSAKSGLPERWDTNERYYRNEPSVAQPVIQGRSAVHMPLIQPLADRLVHGLCTQIVGADPAVTFQAEDPAASEAAERRSADLEMLAQRSGWEQSLWDRFQLAFLCGVCPKRTTVQDGEFVHDVAHPGDWFVSPPAWSDLSRSRFMAVRIERRLAEIEQAQEDRLYFDDVDVDAPSQMDERNVGRAKTGYGKSRGTDDDAEDPVVDLYEAVFRAKPSEDEPEEWYVATFSEDCKAVLRCAPLTQEHSGWADARFHWEYGRYWPDGSLAQNLQGLQDLYDKMHTILVWGAAASAFPAVFAVGGFTEWQVKQYGPQDLIEIPGQVQITQLKNEFNPQSLLAVIQQIERLSNGVVRVSDAAMGQQESGDPTATEISQIAQSQQAAQSAYLSIVARGIEEEFAAMNELFVSRYDEFKRVHGDAIKTRPEDLDVSVRPELTAKGHTSSPGVQMAVADRLYQMAQSAASILDPVKVEYAVLQALPLAQDPDTLIKPEAKAILDGETPVGAMGMEGAANGLGGFVGVAGFPGMGADPAASGEAFGAEAGQFGEPGPDAYGVGL